MWAPSLWGLLVSSDPLPYWDFQGLLHLTFPLPKARQDANKYSSNCPLLRPLLASGDCVPNMSWVLVAVLP